MDETPAPPLASPEDYGARPPDPAPEPVSGAANGHQRPNRLTSIPDSWARPLPIEEDKTSEDGVTGFDPLAGYREMGFDVDGEAQGPGAPYAEIPLTLTEWAWRDLPQRDFLLGSIFTTTTRAMLSAETGLSA